MRGACAVLCCHTSLGVPWPKIHHPSERHTELLRVVVMADDQAWSPA